MNKLIFLFVLFLFSAFNSNACSCNTGVRITFCYSISHNWSVNSPTIIQCVKLGQGVHYNEDSFKVNFMKVKVIQTLHGQTKSDTIIVFGDNSPRCLDYVSQFKINDTLILKAGFSDTSGIYLCGRDYLKFSKGIVSGNINSYPKETSMPFDSFLSFLQSAPCQTSNIIENQQIKNTISLSPNPGHGSFNINFSHPVINGILKIYNSEGKFILSEIISADANSPYPIDLVTQPKGLYFIRITDGFQEMSTRILKY